LKTIVFEKASLDFLKKLSANNNRDWFLKHKGEYDQAKQNAELFVDALIRKMNAHDHLETISGRKSLYRIYNDVRFSKDKSPYNPRFAGCLKRSKPLLRGGYYFWIRPGGSRVGCGFTYPNPDDLKRIRQDIQSNYEDWNKILNARTIKSAFGTMHGEKVKTTPRGYDAGHPAIGLLRFKQYWFERSFTDKEELAPDFLHNINKTYKTIRPFFNYVSDVLGTDLNGESIF
jgi:uncharacterized protein (TIGR02453 family)